MRLLNQPPRVALGLKSRHAVDVYNIALLLVVKIELCDSLLIGLKDHLVLKTEYSCQGNAK
jgi:hypothetical protein